MNFILELMIRPLVRALIRLFDGPQKPYNPYAPIEKYMDDLKAAASNGSESDMRVIHQPGCSLPKTATLPAQPEHADIEKLIHDTVARWHGDQFDRRPLAKVLTETLRPYLKTPAGYRPSSGSNDF